MQNALCVCVVDSFGQRFNVAGSLNLRQGPSAHHGGQAGPFHEIHGEIMQSVELTRLMDGDDVGMLQAGSSAGFGKELPNLGRGGKQSRAHHFQGDNAIQTDLLCAVDHAHAAARDLFEQFIIAEIAQPGQKGSECLAGAVLNRGTQQANRA